MGNVTEIKCVTVVFPNIGVRSAAAAVADEEHRRRRMLKMMKMVVKRFTY